ncbi:MAG TPA: hypothetical protein VG943_00410 [Caulobacterales bacterium]|nr:hypothetical protein [Caulobacterales bacterium]
MRTGAVLVALLASGCSPEGSAAPSLSGLPRNARELVAIDVAQTDGSVLSITHGSLTDQNGPLLASLLYGKDVATFQPFTVEPFVRLVETDAGRELLTAVEPGRPVLNVADLSLAEPECWTDDGARFCGVEAHVSLALSASVTRFLDLGTLPALDQHVVFSEDPQSHAWRLYNAGALRQAVRTLLVNAMTAAERAHDGQYREQIVQDSARTYRAAMDLIYEQFTSIERLDGDVVTLPRQRLQFAHTLVRGQSFSDVYAACRALRVARNADWRLPSRAEFLALFATRGTRSFLLMDTPDERVWGNALDALTAEHRTLVVNSFWVLSSSEPMFPVEEIAAHHGMIVSYEYGLANDGTYTESWSSSPEGYWTPRNLFAPRRVGGYAALCVRATP